MALDQLLGPKIQLTLNISEGKGIRKKLTFIGYAYF